jgi:hypothetical protein
MGTKKTARKTKRPAKAKWQPAFLEALARTSNVTGAARTAGIDVSSVYRCRQIEPEFYRKWQEALAAGYDNLEMDLLHRMRIGQPDGGKAESQRKFDNAVALRLLTAHREAVGRQRALRANDDEEAIIASITEKLERMKERQRAAAALEAESADDDDRAQ